jgi:PTH1 family peptidyl-tRNA hydrolase
VKLVVGLGNPGHRYASTRHNAGFRIAERFAGVHGIDLSRRRFDGRFGCGRLPGRGGEGIDVCVLEPETFMNRSGESVAAALGELPVEDPARDLVVVSDDVDLPFGRLRIRPAGGSAGHRGLVSITGSLGSRAFARLRFGIGRPEGGVDTADYVLEDFSPGEAADLDRHIGLAVEALETMLVEGITVAMNRYNGEPR